MFRPILFGVILLFLANAGDMRSVAQEAAPWAAEKILPAEPGREACYARIYDTKQAAFVILALADSESNTIAGVSAARH